MRLISRTLDQLQSPITVAARLLREYSGHRPLLDLSQGSPAYATALVIADRIAQVARHPDGGKYTAREGLERLRQLLAETISREYAGQVNAEHVLITAGCNQAFCVAISALADHGDEVMLSVPYYFNHDMWLRLDRLSPIYLPPSSQFVPDPSMASALITPKTRAIVLVSPGNPTGVTIPAAVIHAFADIAHQNGVMLILDETYRAFRQTEGPAHDLFSRPDWADFVVSLYSFSKEFAIPGHRVGAAIGHPRLIVEMMKLFDCMAICAPRLGQEAAIEALSSAGAWRRAKADEIRAKQARFETVFATAPGGFELSAAGAFFGWIRHPWENQAADRVVRRLALDYGILVLPGTIFSPTDDRYLRFSFGNLTHVEIDEVGARLREIV